MSRIPLILTAALAVAGAPLVPAVAGAERVMVRGARWGQAGRDRIVLMGSRGGPAPAVRRQVALGGLGADELRGTDEMKGDRLVGGRGQNRANGRGGKLDVCVAEATRNCERS